MVVHEKISREYGIHFFGINLLSRKSTLNFSQIRMNLIMLDGSLFSKTKPRTKQICFIYSTYFLMYNQPMCWCTINIGTPCMYTFIFVIFDPRVLRKPRFIVDDVLKRAGNHLRFTQDKQNARGIAKFRLSRYDLDLQPPHASSRFPFILRRSPTLWFLSDFRTIRFAGMRHSTPWMRLSRGRDSISSWQRARDDRSRRTPRFLCRLQHAPTVTDFDGIDQFIRSQISIGISNCRHFRS